MSQVSYFTEEGLKKLKEELHQLKAHDRIYISKQIAEARDKGDLSENAEYDAAKEAQGLLELKISKLEEVVSNARLIDESTLDVSKALMTYTLVAQNEADLKASKISVDSPIGKGLLGKKVGEIADVVAPSGTIKFEILEISR